MALAAPATSPVPQNLGNPFTGKRDTYARNVWDMQSYNGKIYLGHGDSAANSGNTPIFSLDPKGGTFANEYTTTSEQVDEFIQLSDGLYTLDHDPTGVNYGNFYHLRGNENWEINKNLYSAIHEYGAIEFKGALYAYGTGGGQNGYQGSRIWRSVDNGKSWQEALSSKFTIAGFNWELWGARVYFMFELKGELYALDGWSNQRTPTTEVGLYKLNQQTSKFEKMALSSSVLSGSIVSENGVVRYKRKVALDDGSFLTLLVEGVNDHQWDPRALMHVSAIAPGGISALALPGGAKPYDLVRRGDLVYVCAWDAAQGQNVVFSLPASNVSAPPTEVTRFGAPTFARSFEESEGNFYFGLGCDQTPTPAQTGEIWKVALGKPPVTPTVPQAPAPAPTPSATPTPPPPIEPDADPVGYSNGLVARYYRGMSLKGAPLLQRVEETVNFNVGNGQVVPEAGPSLWSAGYEGFIEAPITGQIKIWTASDDGVRLSIDGKKVIDNWTDHGTTWDGATLDVVRGQKLPLKLEFFQNRGGAALQLHWEWNGKRALVPAGYLWHTDTSAPPIVPAAPPAPAPVPAPVPAPAPAPIPRLAPTPTNPATSNGLVARYYKGINLEGAPLLQRVEQTVNFNAGNGQVVPEAGTALWSAGYEGFIEAPITGQIKIWTLSDDGVRLSIDGKKVIDNWTNHGAAWDGATLDVVKGQKLPLKLEFFQNRGDATLQLHWEWNGKRALVPAEALSHVSIAPTPPATPPATPPTTPPTTDGGTTDVPIAPTEKVGYAPGLVARYYKGINLEGTPLLQRVEGTVNFNVGNGQVVPEAGPSLWSAGYEGFIEAPITGQIKIWTASDDGVRLSIDGKKVIDNWTDHGTTWDGATLDVVRGQKLPLKLEFFQNRGGAALQLHWEWDIQNRVVVPNQNLFHRE